MGNNLECGGLQSGVKPPHSEKNHPMTDLLLTQKLAALETEPWPLVDLRQAIVTADRSRDVALRDHRNRRLLVINNHERWKLVHVHLVDGVAHGAGCAQRWNMGVQDFADRHCYPGQFTA